MAGIRELRVEAGTMARKFHLLAAMRGASGRARRHSSKPERSEELEPLLAAASRAGLDLADGLRLARTTLVTFVWCLPPVERIRFLAALPSGIRRRAAWPRRRTWERREIHTGDEFMRTVTERSGLTWTVKVDLATRRMLTVLHDLAGPEANAVGAALPPRLRPIWTGSTAAEEGGFSLARRVWGETPVRGEWGWMQAPIADVHPDTAGTTSPGPRHSAGLSRW
jgi:uncharacterized protein (DUF2267 family)